MRRVEFQAIEVQDPIVSAVPQSCKSDEPKADPIPEVVPEKSPGESAPSDPIIPQGDETVDPEVLEGLRVNPANPSGGNKPVPRRKAVQRESARKSVGVGAGSYREGLDQALYGRLYRANIASDN
jgi:hypothetical protein